MPVPWVAISAALVLTPAQGVPASTQAGVRQVYGDLVVEAKSATFTEDAVIFREGVRATFAGEILTADSLTLHPKLQTGKAAGHVVLLDPAGSLSAENLQFSWKPEAKGGNASNVHLELAGVMMDAERAESVPGDPPSLIFTNVDGTSCGNEKTPLYSLHSPRVEFHPGKEGIIRRPVLYLFGKRIATLPTQRFSLDPRIRGIPLPGLALGKNKVGVLWAPNFLIDPNTTASINIRSFKGEHLLATAYATRSYLAPQDNNNLVSPHSDLAERFGTSYFDNIRVANPLQGANSLRSRRVNLSIGTEWNHTSLNDPSKAIYSKFLEGIYENGGPLGDKLGYQYSFRLQDMRRNDEPFRTRFITQGSIGPQPYHLGSNVYLSARLDAATFLGNTSFGWARAETGAYIQPKKWLTLGVAFGHGEEFGKAMYQADRLLIRDQGMARIDLDFGPTKFSLLQKRDFDRDRWYREYSASQVMGCVEAFVTSREFPRSYQLGLKLRLDDFFAILRKRKLQLGGTATTTKQPAPPMQHAIHP